MPTPTPFNSRDINDIVVDVRPTPKDPQTERDEELVKWVISHVDEWEQGGQFPAHEVFKKLGSAGCLGVNKPVGKTFMFTFIYGYT